LDSIEPVIRSRVGARITFYDAYLISNDDKRIPEFYGESQAETFRREYSGLKFDLVIASAPQAVVFVVKYRDKIFPGVPIVFTEIGTREFGGRP
jgi:hypothetical protein